MVFSHVQIEHIIEFQRENEYLYALSCSKYWEFLASGKVEKYSATSIYLLAVQSGKWLQSSNVISVSGETWRIS